MSTYNLEHLQHQSFQKTWKVYGETMLEMQQKSVYAKKVLKSSLFKVKALPGISFQFELHFQGQDMILHTKLVFDFEMNVSCQYSLGINESALQYFRPPIQRLGGIMGYHKLSPNEGGHPVIIGEFFSVFICVTLKVISIQDALHIDREEIAFKISSLLYDDEDGKDCTVVVGGNRIRAHSYILEEYSSAFEFSDDGQIFIDGYSIEAVQYAIDFFYQRKIWEPLFLQRNMEVVVEIMRFANFFSVESLKEAMENLLIQLITNENLCEIANVAVEYDAELLKESCVVMLLANADNSTFPGREALHDQILAEIGRRSFMIVNESNIVI